MKNGSFLNCKIIVSFSNIYHIACIILVVCNYFIIHYTQSFILSRHCDLSRSCIVNYFNFSSSSSLLVPGATVRYLIITMPRSYKLVIFSIINYNNHIMFPIIYNFFSFIELALIIIIHILRSHHHHNRYSLVKLNLFIFIINFSQFIMSFLFTLRNNHFFFIGRK